MRAARTAWLKLQNHENEKHPRTSYIIQPERQASFFRRAAADRTFARKKHSVSQIAGILQRCRSSVYRETKRGLVERVRPGLSKHLAYNADAGKRVRDENSGAGGLAVKLRLGSPLCRRLAELVAKEAYSPYAALDKQRKKDSSATYAI